MAEEITLDQFLVMDTMSPETRTAQRPGGELRLGAGAFLITMTDLNDPEGAYVTARRVVEKAWEDADALNTIAWTIVDNELVTHRDYDLAMKATQRSATELVESGLYPA